MLLERSLKIGSSYAYDPRVYSSTCIAQIVGISLEWLLSMLSSPSYLYTKLPGLLPMLHHILLAAIWLAIRIQRQKNSGTWI